MRLIHGKYGLLAGIVVLTTAWALFAFGVTPALERLATLKRVIPEKQNELERLRMEAHEYASLRQAVEDIRTKIASQEKTVGLLPFVESLVAECDLTQNVTTMRQVPTQSTTDYQEIVLEIEMKNVTLRQLCEFIEKIQTPKLLASIRRLTINKNSANPKLVDSNVEVHNFKLTPTDTIEYRGEGVPPS
ncbi:MAG: hypothetical protein A2Z25_20390 [Planctomycetes bacterium RBG_16_55_9]|nr:MAG: hypothetical protein A2Z25_20390 [Planctomycetes bacterium RBG_16_55_9]